MKALALLMLLPALALAAGTPAENIPATSAPTAPTPASTPANGAPSASAAENTPVVASSSTLAPAPYAEKFRQDAHAVLQGPDFHRVEEGRGLTLRPWLRWLLKKRKPEPATPFNFSLAGLAALLKLVMVAVLILALAWLLWKGWQWLAPLATRRRPPKTSFTPQETQSLALAGDTLPEQVSRAARSAWQRGEAVLALSLLYRGAVRVLEERHHIELPGSATEGECLRIARRSGKAVVQSGFAPIVRAWMALAYAQRPPEDFDALARLYASHFETAGADA